MHAQHGDPGIHGNNVPVCHVSGYRTAAALVNLTQGGNLPFDTRRIQRGANVLHGLGGSIGGAALAPGAGVFADGHAIVELTVVPAVAGFGEVGVKGIGNIRGQAEGVGKALPKLYPLAVAQDLHEILKGMALHTADAHGADLFLVGQDAHGGVSGGFQIQQGFQLRIGANPVIVAVGTQQAPVQAHLPALAGRDNRQLRGAEVFLHHAVLLVQQAHDVQFHQIRALALQRLGAQEHIQLLAKNPLCQGLLHLIRGQVDQQVGDHQNGVALVLTDGDGYLRAVLLADHAVNGKGHAGPLILFDAAIVMGFGKGDFGILIQGLGLQIQPGRIHMGSADIGALCQRFRTHNGNQEALAPVVQIDLIAGFYLHAGHRGPKAPCLCLPGGPGGGFPLRLAGIHKSGIALAVVFHFLTLLACQLQKAILGAAEQGFTQFFNSHIVPPYMVLLCFHYTQFPQKGKAFPPEVLPAAGILQNIITALRKPLLGMLGSNTAAGVLFRNAVPEHQPPEPVFPGCGHCHGFVAELGQASFMEANGINGSQAGGLFQPPPDLPLHRGVGDGVQLQQRFFIRKNHRPQFFPIQDALCHRTWEPGIDFRQHLPVCFQQIMVDLIAVQHQSPLLLNAGQEGGLSAAGTASNSQYHSSASASTMWKAAAFFSRFCTA